MKKIVLLISFFVLLNSFAIHKFYVSIYQIEYTAPKKMLQITARIFVDDLNHVLNQKYKIKTHIGETNESTEDINLLKKYLLEKISIQINGKPKTIQFLSTELESNVVMCYLNVRDVSKIKTLEIQNTALLELDPDQQNIIQTKIYSKKQNLILTSENVKGLLKIQ